MLVSEQRPTWKIFDRSTSSMVELIVDTDATPDELSAAMKRSEAAGFVAWSSAPYRKLADIARHLGNANPIDPLEVVQRAIGAGTLIAVRRQIVPIFAVTAAAEPEDVPAPAPVKDSSLTFIEIVLVDDDHKPVAGERYHIELADGRTIDGSLDDDGSAMIDQIDPGSCKVSFPDLDKQAVSGPS